MSDPNFQPPNQQPEVKPKKPLYKRWWFWVIIVFIVLPAFSSALSGGGSKKPANNDAISSSQSQSQQDNKDGGGTEGNTPDAGNASGGDGVAANTDTSADSKPEIPTQYTLAAGYYTAGIDIPYGRCNVVAVSGHGNLSSSNMYNGGINEIFGIDDDGSGFYTQDFSGLKLPKSTVLHVSGSLVIEINYTTVDGGFTSRSYNEDAAITLNSGNYIAGTDFPSGTYKIVVVSGHGNLSSSNIFNGGINEIVGVDDGTDFYIQEFTNVSLPANTELEVSGGLVIKIIPAN